jgi:hypothetical protein
MAGAMIAKGGNVIKMVDVAAFSIRISKWSSYLFLPNASNTVTKTIYLIFFYF